MVDKKISELEQAQAVSPDDLLAIVQNVNNSLQTNRITIEKLLSSYGGSSESGIAGGFVENFPLSIAEGSQNINPGFYGVRFTPGTNFVVKYAQVCKRDNVPNGAFVIAIYSQGATSPTGSRTEDMMLLAKTSPKTFPGDNGIIIAEFPEQEQIILEADKEYYMVLYVQHTGDKGLICRKTVANNWGSSYLTLAFKGSSQTVQATLGSSDFDTLFPSSSVNEIIMPYIKIYGDAGCYGKNILVINSSNYQNYIGDSGLGGWEWLIIPPKYDIICVDDIQLYGHLRLWGIRPAPGTDFTNGKRIIVLGYCNFNQPDASLPSLDYTTSEYYYYYTHNSNYRPYTAYLEFIYYNKRWYSKGY